MEVSLQAAFNLSLQATVSVQAQNQGGGAGAEPAPSLAAPNLNNITYNAKGTLSRTNADGTIMLVASGVESITSTKTTGNNVSFGLKLNGVTNPFLAEELELLAVMKGQSPAIGGGLSVVAQGGAQQTTTTTRVEETTVVASVSITG